MFLCVFAGAKKRSGEMARFQFLTLASWGVAIFSLQKVPESVGDSGVVPYLFGSAKHGLWIKTKFGRPAIPWSELLTLTLNHQKKGGTTGKIISSLNPHILNYRFSKKLKLVLFGKAHPVPSNHFYSKNSNWLLWLNYEFDESYEICRKPAKHGSR